MKQITFISFHQNGNDKAQLSYLFETRQGHVFGFLGYEIKPTNFFELVGDHIIEYAGGLDKPFVHVTDRGREIIEANYVVINTRYPVVITKATDNNGKEYTTILDIRKS